MLRPEHGERHGGAAGVARRDARIGEAASTVTIEPYPNTKPDLKQMEGTVFVGALGGGQAAPEIGHCYKVPGAKVGRTTVYSGAYTSSKCITKSETNSGEYEWAPGFTNGGFTGEGGAMTLAVAGKATITCKASSDSGDYTGLKGQSVGITLKECATTGRHGAPCQSSGQSSGVIVSATLAGSIGFIDQEQGLAGVDLAPASPGGTVLATFDCGGTEERIEGSVVGTAAVDDTTTHGSVKFKASAGKQVPEALEAGLRTR